MSLENITITNFLNLRSCVLQDLSPGLNLIVGKNGAGKTNILRAIRFALCDNNDEWKCPDVEAFNNFVHDGNKDYFFVEVVVRNVKQTFPDFEVDQSVTFKREFRRSIIPDDPPVQYCELNGRLVKREEYKSVLSFLPASIANPFVVAKKDTLFELFNMDVESRLKIFEDYIGLKPAYWDTPRLQCIDACIDQMAVENANCTAELAEVSAEARRAQERQQLEAHEEELQENLKSAQADQVSAIRFTEMRGKLDSTKEQVRMRKTQLESLKNREKTVQNQLQVATHILERKELDTKQWNDEMCILEKQISEMEFNSDDTKSLKAQLRAANDEYQKSISKFRVLVERRRRANFQNMDLYEKKKRLALWEIQFRLKLCRSQDEKEECVRSKLLERKEDLEATMLKRTIARKIIDETNAFIRTISEDMTSYLSDQLTRKQKELDINSKAMMIAERVKASAELSYKQLNDETSQHGRVIVENDKLKKEIRKAMVGFEGGIYLGMLLDFINCTPDVALAVEAVGGEQLFAHVVDTTKAADFLRRNINSEALNILDLEKLQVPRELMNADADLLLDKVNCKPVMNNAVRAIFGLTYIVNDFDDALKLAKSTERNVVTPDGKMVNVSDGSLRMTGGFKDEDKCIVIQYLKYEAKSLQFRKHIETAEDKIDSYSASMGKIVEEMGVIQAKIACRNPDAGRQLRNQQRRLTELEERLASIEADLYLKEMQLQYLQSEYENGGIFNTDVSASEIFGLKKEILTMETEMSATGGVTLKEISEQKLEVNKMRDQVAQAQNEIYTKLDCGFRFVDDDELAALKKKLEDVKRLLQQDPEGNEVNRLAVEKLRCENELHDTEDKVYVLETNLYKELEEEEELVGAMRELQIQPDVNDDFESRKQAAEELRRLLDENRETIDDLDANPSAIEKEKAMRRELDAQGGAINKYREDVKTFQQMVKASEEKQLRTAEQAIIQINANFKAIFNQLFSKQPSWTAKLNIAARTDVQGHWWDIAFGIGIEIHMGGLPLQNFDGLSPGQKILVGFALLAAVNRFDPAPYYLFENILRNFISIHSVRLSVLNMWSVPEIKDILQAMSEKSQVIIASTDKDLEDIAKAVYAVEHIPAENRADVKKIR